MLDNIDEVLIKDMILKMYKMLKRGTTDEDNPLYNVSGFKKVPNIIGLQNVIETSSPKNAENDLEELLLEYKKLQEVTLKDIILHFQDIYDEMCNKLLDYDI